MVIAFERSEHSRCSSLSIERSRRETGNDWKIVDLQGDLSKQSFPPGHRERFTPGTIYVRASIGFNRSHPR